VGEKRNVKAKGRLEKGIRTARKMEGRGSQGVMESVRLRSEPSWSKGTLQNPKWKGLERWEKSHHKRRGDPWPLALEEFEMRGGKGEGLLSKSILRKSQKQTEKTASPRKADWCLGKKSGKQKRQEKTLWRTFNSERGKTDKGKSLGEPFEEPGRK